MNLVIDCFKLVKGSGKSIGIYNLAKSIAVHLGERMAAGADRQGEGICGGNVRRGQRGRSKGERGQTVNMQADNIIVLGNSYNREEFDVPGVTFVEVNGNPMNKLYCILWELVLVRKYAKLYQADRVLFPRGYRPLGVRGCIGRRRDGGKIRDTILIHDLIPFYYDKYYPGVFNKLENAYIMYRLKVSMKKADRIITISEYSQKDILDKVPGCGGKITVIHNGLNDVAYERVGGNGAGIKDADKGTAGGDYGEAGSGRRQFKGGIAGGSGAGLDMGKEREDKGVRGGGYIAAMTSGLPHKNAAGVLKTYEAYYKTAANPLELVVFGIGDTSAWEGMDREAAAHVRCYKFFEKFEDMCRMAAGAEAYLFLSYVEGFGFPPLEAMQLGVPVVCSDRSSLPEVVGDAGLLVSPDDYEGAARALVRVTAEEGLREELIRRGYENIRRFSWESRTELYWKELFR